MKNKYKFHLWTLYVFLISLGLLVIGIIAASNGAEEAIILVVLAGISTFSFGITHLLQTGLKYSIELNDSHIALKRLIGKKEIPLSDINEILSITKFAHHTHRSGARNTILSKKITFLNNNLKPLLKINAEAIKDKYNFYKNIKELAKKNKKPIRFSIVDKKGIRLSFVSINFAGLFSGGLKDIMEKNLREKDPFMVHLKKALESGKISKDSWILMMGQYKRFVEKEENLKLKQQKSQEMTGYIFS
ncbi:hypothetical protein GOV06_01895 [Candidatus Woesearchaeota archaeon]|nr:hypothetical protein [Candidatus Woesearchaeota archaeon]